MLGTIALDLAVDPGTGQPSGTWYFQWNLLVIAGAGSLDATFACDGSEVNATFADSQWGLPGSNDTVIPTGMLIGGRLPVDDAPPREGESSASRAPALRRSAVAPCPSPVVARTRRVLVSTRERPASAAAAVNSRGRTISSPAARALRPRRALHPGSSALPSASPRPRDRPRPRKSRSRVGRFCSRSSRSRSRPKWARRRLSWRRQAVRAGSSSRAE
jgi:hypothetical protein